MDTSNQGEQAQSKQPEFVPDWIRKGTRGCCLGVLLLPLIIAFIVLFQVNTPTDLSPEKAHYETEKWVGREVRVVGWLRLFEGSTGPHYGVEDAQQNRVGVQEYDPKQLSALIDKKVVVEGKFNFDQQFGIYVVARSVKPINQ